MMRETLIGLVASTILAGCQTSDPATTSAAGSGDVWAVTMEQGDGVCTDLSIGEYVVADQQVRAAVTHPKDGPFDFSAPIAADGSFKASASGALATVAWQGHVAGRKGFLSAMARGEAACTARWLLRKG